MLTVLENFGFIWLKSRGGTVTEHFAQELLDIIQKDFSDAGEGDEIVISKMTSSVFNSTNIDRLLRNMGIKNLIIMGLVTNGCVESSTRSAAELDYVTIVVEDATAAMAPQLHEHSILSMSYKDAVIRSADEVVIALETLM